MVGSATAKAVRALPLAGALLFAAACGAPDPDTAEESAPSSASASEVQTGSNGLALAAEPAAGSQEAQPPFFSPGGGPPGSEVEIWMDGLPAEAPIMIGFGTIREHEIIEQIEVDEEGSIRLDVVIPESARENASHYFFIADATTQQPLSVSAPFHVTAEDGTAVIEAEVADEGTGCPVLHGRQDQVYTLQGNVPDLRPGMRVRVTGTLAHDSSCDEGLTIDAQTVEVDP